MDIGRRNSLLFLTLIFALVLEGSGGVGVGLHPGGFCYNHPGCDEKSGKWSGTCKTGTKQSPIDLPLPRDASTLTPSKSLDFNYAGYSSDSFNIVDNGHTIQIILGPTASVPIVKGYELDGIYEFATAHFHWGNRNHPGSEHSLGGRRFPGELHLVHFKKSHGSVAAAAAANDPKGLLVIGCFLDDVSSTNVEGKNVHYALNPIVTNFPQTYDPIGKRVKQRIDLSPFLPNQGDVVYRYQGSLTTPNCSESVLWTIVHKPYIVSSNDLRRFQNVRDEENKHLTYNNRHIQKTHGRIIELFKVQ